MCCNSDLYPIFQTCCRVYQYLSRFCVNSFTWRNPVIVDHEAWNLACIGKIFSLSYQINFFFFLSQLWKFSFKVLRLEVFFFTSKRVSNDFRDFPQAYMLSFEISLETPSPPETRTVINQGTYIQCERKMCLHVLYTGLFKPNAIFTQSHSLKI